MINKFLMMVLAAASALFADQYWVSPIGAATWANAKSATSLSGAECCLVSTANTGVVAGDTVNIRVGTYVFIGDFIAPANSGTYGNPIVYIPYNGEEVIVYGSESVAGYNSRAVWLTGKCNIVVRGMVIQNVYRFFGITNSDTCEISYCTATFRDPWADIRITGTCTNETPSATLMDDATANWETNYSVITSGRIYNKTDGSTSYQPNSNGATRITSTSYPLVGGTDNLWEAGDVYEITPIYPYNDAPCNIEGASTENWIHHNNIHGMGGFLEQQDGSPLFQIGADQGAADYNNNNTIEYNHIYHGGHHVLGVNLGLYNVIRHNYLHNESWFSDQSYSGNCHDGGLCGYRVLSCGVDAADRGGFCLFEDNFVGYGGQYGGTHLVPTGSSGSGTTLATPNNIYRYNMHVGNANYGLRFGSSISGAGNNNAVYNNTFYYHGYRVGIDPHNEDEYRSGIYFNGQSSGNIIKNNLVYNVWSQNNKLETSYWPGITAGNSSINAAYNVLNNTIENNYVNTNGGTYFSSATALAEMNNPTFTSIVLPENTSQIISAWSNDSVTSPILTLQSNSPCRNVAKALTLSNGEGSSTATLVVDCSSYFQDGTWGSLLASLNPDVVAIGESRDTATVTAVDYTENTITLSRSLSWGDNDSIFIFKKSDGVRVLYEGVPEYGAKEFYPPEKKYSNGYWSKK